MSFENYSEYQRAYEKYWDMDIAKKIVDMGLGANFIAIGIGMVNDDRCDLDGAVGKYASAMQALVRKALYALEEEEYDNEARNKVEE